VGNNSREYNREHKRKLRARWVTEGKCKRCGASSGVSASTNMLCIHCFSPRACSVCGVPISCLAKRCKQHAKEEIDKRSKVTGKKRRERRTALGLCMCNHTGCLTKSADDNVSCEAHLGLCIHSGCSAKSVVGRASCEVHLTKARKRAQQQYRAKQLAKQQGE
jgi:hypothetical protein